MWCVFNSSLLMKKHRAIKYPDVCPCPGLCTPCEAAGRSAVGPQAGQAVGLETCSVCLVGLGHLGTPG